MKDACEKWKDQLLEAALTGAKAKDFEEHLRVCTICSRELEAVRARRMRLDGLLPLVALMIGATMYRRAAQRIPEKELAAVQRLAEWRAPSDVLLATPGQEILRTMPRLGESYLNVPVKTDEEE